MHDAPPAERWGGRPGDVGKVARRRAERTDVPQPAAWPIRIARDGRWRGGVVHVCSPTSRVLAQGPARSGPRSSPAVGCRLAGEAPEQDGRRWPEYGQPEDFHVRAIDGVPAPVDHGVDPGCHAKVRRRHPGMVVRPPCSKPCSERFRSDQFRMGSERRQTGDGLEVDCRPCGPVNVTRPLASPLIFQPSSWTRLW